MKCEACGSVPEPLRCESDQYVRVRTTNGGLLLCRRCLTDINSKNPEVSQLRAERDGLQSILNAATNRYEEQIVAEMTALRLGIMEPG